MKTVSSKSLCGVFKDGKLILKGEFEYVCKKLFASGIIQMYPDKCYTKVGTNEMVKDWSKIAFYMDELLEDGYIMEIKGDEVI